MTERYPLLQGAICTRQTRTSAQVWTRPENRMSKGRQDGATDKGPRRTTFQPGSHIRENVKGVKEQAHDVRMNPTHSHEEATNSEAMSSRLVNESHKLRSAKLCHVCITPMLSSFSERRRSVSGFLTAPAQFERSSDITERPACE